MLSVVIELRWVVVLLLIFLFIRKPIISILYEIANIGKKAKSVKYKDMSVELGSSKIPSSIIQNNDPKMKHLEYLKSYQSEVITEEERSIRKAISTMQETQAIDVLIYHLANAKLIIFLLIINQAIFKEQIQLLKYLNSQVHPVSENYLFLYYEEYMKNNSQDKKTTFTFKMFIDYLYLNSLITREIPDIKLRH